MKRNAWIKICCLLLMIATIGALLIACKKDTDENADETTETVESADTGDLLTLVRDGKAECKVFYPAKGTQKEAQVAFSLATKLRTYYGTEEVPCSDDYETKETVSTDDVEILIGNVKRTESETVYKKLRAATDYAVVVSGNKLVISAKSDEGYEEAIAYLEEQFLKKGESTLAIPRDVAKYRLLSDNVMLDNLASYTIIFPDGAAASLQKAAVQLSEDLALYLRGKKINVTSDKAEETDLEILVGNTNRAASVCDEELDYFDYLIRKVGNKYVFNLGSSLRAKPAVEDFVYMMVRDQFEGTHKVGLDASLLNPLASDYSSFQPAWVGDTSLKWDGASTVPAWMRDFNEKLYALTTPLANNRPMTIAHRADMIHYPEDSLEGILSAIFLGTDAIEMDVKLTKDNVLVALHDSTLSRTTNVDSLKGKKGLPNSVKLEDWTFEQLQQLNLTQNGNVTPYKIPSYYDILKVVRGNCFIAIDLSIDGLYTVEDVLEIEAATDSFEVSFYSFFLSSGAGPAGGNRSAEYLINYSKSNPQNTRLAGYAAKMTTYLAKSGHKVRTRSWIGGSATTSTGLETFEQYKNAYEVKKIGIIYTNHIARMSTFIATYGPTQVP